MTSGKWLRRALPVVFFVVLAPSFLFAQDVGKLELAGGYASLWDDDNGPAFRRGWFASPAVEIARPVSIAAEIAGSHRTISDIPEVRMSLGIYTVAAGPRVAWPGTGRFSAYGQVLAGVARISTGLNAYGYRDSIAQNYFAVIPGGGLDVQFAKRGAVRVGTSVRLIRTPLVTPAGSEPFTYRQFQFTTGVVLW